MAPDMCDGYTTKAEPSENDAYIMGNLGTIFVYMVWEACILDKWELPPQYRNVAQVADALENALQTPKVAREECSWKQAVVAVAWSLL